MTGSVIIKCISLSLASPELNLHSNTFFAYFSTFSYAVMNALYFCSTGLLFCRLGEKK